MNTTNEPAGIDLDKLQRFNNRSGLMNPEAHGLYVRFEEVADLARRAPAPVAVALDKDAEKQRFITWGQVFHRNARSYTARDFDHGLAAWLAAKADAVAQQSPAPVVAHDAPEAPASAQPDRGAAQAADVCAEMRALCPHCGGTGDVHRADGEWLGACDCPAPASGSGDAGGERAECTNSDSWNCKYCPKTDTCAALKDPRNFGTPASGLDTAVLDKLEALARKAYLANEVVAMIPPAKILDLIAQARASQPEGATGTTGAPDEWSVIAQLPDIHTALVQAYRAGALRNGPNGIDADAYAEAERAIRAWNLPDAAPASAQPDRGAAQDDNGFRKALEEIAAMRGKGDCASDLIDIADSALAGLYATSPASQPVAPEAAQADYRTYDEACNLAKAIHAQHYRDDSPNWRVLPDLRGVISQISNMVAGMTRTHHVYRLTAPTTVPDLGILPSHSEREAANAKDAARVTYTCKGKGGAYSLIGVAYGAGTSRDTTVNLYREVGTGVMYFRTPADFHDRMERINAAMAAVGAAGQEGGK
jgi:hypothetical protein